jgi:hypothetical protein
LHLLKNDVSLLEISQNMKKLIIPALLLLTSPVFACTSMIIGSKASANGRPMLWKHRDTGAEDNFVERVAHDGTLTYVALFNGGDSLLSEAWMGVNEAGFAIMNTASYNLAPDTAKIKDREGLVMSRALQVCHSIDDFKNLLDTLPKPLGVQANFGVIDALGNGAYFETNDYTYTPFYLSDTDNDVLVRTNYSVSGNDSTGMGYIRYDNACHILADRISDGGFIPQDFTERASRSFYHSLLNKDMLADSTAHWAVDQDFIPRRISSASIVIEGVKLSENTSDATMWTTIGYPPLSHVQKVTINNVPDGLRPLQPGYKSADCNEVISRKRKAFSINRGNGQHYVNLDYIRSQEPQQRLLSIKAYNGK